VSPRTPRELSALTRRARRDERGSFTFMVVFWALMTMMLGGLVVDGSLAITERQRAGDIAEQAARAAADDLDPNQLRAGNYVLLDDYCGQAKLVGTTSGLDSGQVSCDSPPGTFQVPGGPVVPLVTVHVQITYTPILLSMFFSQTFTANASANAHPQPGF
jgi:putative Flp pilus-assembly TadE/G-like protein